MPSLPGWQTYVIDPLSDLLQTIAGGVGGYGIAIILFTLAIRLVILPLTAKQMKSQRAMQELQPKINAIKKASGGDRQKDSQLTMELYKKEGVNPVAGCFPLLIQMPILFGLYGALLTVSQCVGPDAVGIGRLGYQDCLAAGGHMLMDEQFLWFNLADIDRTFSIPVGDSIPLPGYISVIALMAGVVQWIQTYMATPINAEGTQATMGRVMQFMPIMIVLFAWNFFSGIVVYWVISSFLGVVQQFFTTGLGKFERILPEGVVQAAGRGGAGRLGVPKMTKEESDRATAAAEAELNLNGGTDKPRPKTRARKRRRRRG
jgi:YidC/Oxa1 family membrane protein insertase